MTTRTEFDAVVDELWRLRRHASAELTDVYNDRIGEYRHRVADLPSQQGPPGDQTEPRCDIGEVFDRLDSWVCSLAGNKNAYVGDGDFDFPIQQVREEIAQLTQVLLGLPKRRAILEIGLGSYGGTHFLWQSIFQTVVTIEGAEDRILGVSYPLDLGRDVFLFGNSNDPSMAIRAMLWSPYDALFIDGDHSYLGTLTDWRLYGPLVRPGGVIAFHDTDQPDAPGVEVGKVLRQHGHGYDFQRISTDKNIGIAYYRTPE